MRKLIDGKLGKNHAGELHRETAKEEANRIISEEPVLASTACGSLADRRGVSKRHGENQ